jgi:hypothetical protein
MSGANQSQIDNNRRRFHFKKQSLTNKKNGKYMYIKKIGLILYLQKHLRIMLKGNLLPETTEID